VQTKFVIFMSIFGIISALCFSTNQNFLLSIITALIAAAFGLAAYFARDKKDKQIEEIHAEITNSNKSKPTETSTKIIESYMETAHKIENDNYIKGVVSINNNMAARGIYNSGIAVMNIRDLKLTHIKSFIDSCMEYVSSIQSNYLLDKHQVKILFENYRATDITEITSIIKNQIESRGLLRNDAMQQEIMPPIISEINNAYSVAFLRIDSM
jgi:hypothetical protein